MNSLSLRQMGMLLVLTPALFSIVFLVALSVLISSAQNDFTAQQESKEILGRLYGFEGTIAQSLFRIIRGFEQDAPNYAEDLNRLRERVRSSKESLKVLVRQRPGEKELAASTESLCDRSLVLIDRLEKIHADPDIKPKDRPKLIRSDFYTLVMELRPALDDLHRREQQLRLQSAASRGDTGIWILLLCGLALNASLTIFLANLFSRHLLSRLKAISANANCLAIGKPLASAVPGSDELTMLDAALHQASDKLAETRRRELAFLSHAREVLCSLDSSTSRRIATVGEAARKLWGYEPDELLGAHASSLIVQEDARVFSASLESLSDERGNVTFEAAVKRKDRSRMPTLWTAAAESGGERIFLVARDITEQKELEQAKQRFLSMVSHDLRAPLASIDNTLCLLLEGNKGELPERAGKILGRNRGNVGRLLALVNELLDIERLETGKLKMETGFVSGYDVIMAAVDSVEAFASARSIKVEHAATDVAIRGDDRRLVQVLVNFLSNAIKFSPKESTVTIELEIKDGLGEFAVCDRGPGIDPAYLANIFDRFSGARTSSDSGVKSSGLGLSISKAIIEAQGGEVGVSSRPGEGSRFWFRMPLFTDESE